MTVNFNVASENSMVPSVREFIFDPSKLALLHTISRHQNQCLKESGGNGPG